MKTRLKSMLAAAGAVLFFGGSAFAELSAPDKALLERLNSPQWAEREAASTELFGQPWDLARLQEMYKAAPSLEARERLLAAGRQQYFNKLVSSRTSPDDAGALGVLKPPQAMAVQPAGSVAPVKALFIASPICGMPSAVVLRPGDRIVKIDQTDLTQLPADAEPFDALAARVRRTRAGESLNLVIDRDGNRLETTLKVGSGNGMSVVEQARGFGARPEVVEKWLSERNKIILGTP